VLYINWLLKRLKPTSKNGLLAWQKCPFGVAKMPFLRPENACLARQDGHSPVLNGLISLKK